MYSPPTRSDSGVRPIDVHVGPGQPAGSATGCGWLARSIGAQDSEEPPSPPCPPPADAELADVEAPVVVLLVAEPAEPIEAVDPPEPVEPPVLSPHATEPRKNSSEAAVGRMSIIVRFATSVPRERPAGQASWLCNSRWSRARGASDSAPWTRGVVVDAIGMRNCRAAA